MKLTRRWLLNSLAAMSLILCVATAAIWVVSYFRGFHPAPWIQPNVAYYQFQIYNGKFTFYREPLWGGKFLTQFGFYHLGFYFMTSDRGRYDIEIPAYALAALFAAMPALWLVRSRPPHPRKMPMGAVAA